MKEERESDIEEYFTERAEAFGFKQRKIAFIGRNGGQDRLLIAECGQFNPVVWLVEVKRPNGKPRIRQEREMLDLAKAGIQRRVVCNRNDVDALMFNLQTSVGIQRRAMLNYWGIE